MTHKPLTFGPLELATEFLKRLQKCIGKRKFREACQLNAEEVSADVCHSHDYCDANMVMDAAFKKLAKRSIWMPYDFEEGNCTEAEHDIDFRMWNMSWDMATKQMSFIHRNKITVNY